MKIHGRQRVVGYNYIYKKKKGNIGIKELRYCPIRIIIAIMNLYNTELAKMDVKQFRPLKHNLHGATRGFCRRQL